jgi:hypothetical protein
MITILSVLACVHGHNAMCVACDDPSYHENYLAENYPRFELRFYTGGKGYFI